MRFLLIDFRKDHHAIFSAGGAKPRRLEAHPLSGGLTLFAEILRKFRLSRRKPSAVIATAGAGGSWSAARQAAAISNALAFAWDLPLAELPVQSDEDDATMIGRAAEAARTAVINRWTRAAYDGEPNITSARNKLIKNS